MEEKAKTQGKNRIHYTFLIDDEDRLIPCDDAAQDFLESIDKDVIGAQILKLQFNSAMTVSTVILDNISYSLKVIPVANLEYKNSEKNARLLSSITHIVIMQNQFLFAELLHDIGKYKIYSKEFDKIVEFYDDAIYINKSNGEPLCFNERYLEATQFSYGDFFGANAYTDDSELFTPVVTPTVIAKKVDVTTFQHCRSGVDIITTGIPIYLSTGNFNLVLFVLSALSNPEIKALSETVKNFV